jgi:hypothetical protein
MLTDIGPVLVVVLINCEQIVFLYLSVVRSYTADISVEIPKISLDLFAAFFCGGIPKFFNSLINAGYDIFE